MPRNEQLILTKAEISKLAEREHVQNMSGLSHDEIIHIINNHFDDVICVALIYSEYSQRMNAVKVVDIVHALKGYGYEIF